VVDDPLRGHSEEEKMENQVKPFTRKLDEVAWKRVQELKNQDVPLAEIAAEFQVTAPCISKLGRTYRFEAA
jgi:hypothetical protein